MFSNRFWEITLAPVAKRSHSWRIFFADSHWRYVIPVGVTCNRNMTDVRTLEKMTSSLSTILHGSFSGEFTKSLFQFGFCSVCRFFAPVFKSWITKSLGGISPVPRLLCVTSSTLLINLFFPLCFALPFLKDSNKELGRKENWTRRLSEMYYVNRIQGRCTLLQ